MKNNPVHRLCISAMFFAVGLVLPFLTGQIPFWGRTLLPMHIPVVLCGILCGWQYGAVIGFTLPLFRGFLFGAPELIPGGISMAFELVVYGGVTGFLYMRKKEKTIPSIYLSMIPGVLFARIAWGLMRWFISGIQATQFDVEMFLTIGFVNSLPGLLLQFLLVPLLVTAVQKYAQKIPEKSSS